MLPVSYHLDSSFETSPICNVLNWALGNRHLKHGLKDSSTKNMVLLVVPEYSLIIFIQNSFNIVRFFNFLVTLSLEE